MAASLRHITGRFSVVISTLTQRLRMQNATEQNSYSHNCRYCSTTTAKPWHLMSGICVERYPVISQPLTAIEEEYKEMCDVVELESSVLSEHEIQVNKDRERIQKRKEGELDDNVDEDVLTALDVEDLNTEKLNEFQPAPRETEADAKNDTRSTDRKLSDKLVLLVQEQIGRDKVWLLPHGERKDGESMREAAERVLSSCAEENRMKVQFVGNAPVGFYKYKYPREVQEKLGVQGAKVFYFKARLLHGDYKSRADAGITDHKWLTRDELDSHLLKGYSETIKKFILPVTY